MKERKQTKSKERSGWRNNYFDRNKKLQ